MFTASDLDVDELVAAKAGRRTSVCVPAKDEAGTIGPIVAAIVAELVEARPLVDEVVVVDDGSTDGTAAVAAAAGAVVVRAGDVLPEVGPGTGKGEALWKSLAASSGDLVAWCDADIVDFDPRFVVGLLGPLLLHRQLGFVKGCYERPVGGVAAEGGRVTELVARPLIALLLPELGAFAQPLSGEYAGRRDVLERLPFTQGYGVDLGLLADAFAVLGPEGTAQVDLGVRTHRNRPLLDLAPTAVAVLHEGLDRAGVDGMAWPATLHHPGRPARSVGDGVRPPLRGVPGYRKRAS
jgi:glucosyl-3-phosphoglycerate synthase